LENVPGQAATGGCPYPDRLRRLSPYSCSLQELHDMGGHNGAVRLRQTRTVSNPYVDSHNVCWHVEEV
jgi:hypothetical protein